LITVTVVGGRGDVGSDMDYRVATSLVGSLVTVGMGYIYVLLCA
jgi:hypothetical protein